MTALLHFEDKVHHKGLVRAEGLPLLMPRLLSQVLEHLGFPEEPRIERRISCTQVLSMERSLTMPISFVLQQQDREEVPDEIAEDPLRGEDPVPKVEVEMERSPVHDLSPPSPPPPPSFTAHHSPKHVQVSSRELTLLWCCLHACYHTGVVGPAVGPSRGHYRAQSCHASTYHEPPRSPA